MNSNSTPFLKIILMLFACFSIAFAAGGPGGGGGSGGGSGGGASASGGSGSSSSAVPSQYNSFPCISGQCWIDGKCWNDGMQNFLNDSQFCNSTAGQFSWSQSLVPKIANVVIPAVENSRQNGVNESSLDCGNLNTLKERVKCRIELPNTELNVRLAYLPEECRVLSGGDRKECLERFDKVQKCRKLSTDDERDSCFSNEVNFKGVSSLDSCGNDRACVKNVEEGVFKLAKFRIYNLEEKAEDVSGKYPLLESFSIDFISGLELEKQRFNVVEGIFEKRKIITGVIARWEKFKKDIQKEFLRVYGSK